MKFSEFQKKMRVHPMFSMHDLRLIFPDENIRLMYLQIFQWLRQKKLLRLKRGFYILSLEYLKEPVSAEAVAAKLYDPSYVSLEYALSLYGLIPEAVFEMTCVTPKATRIFETPVGVFRYRTLKSSCFFGFSVVRQDMFPTYRALPEKALLDFLYLNVKRFQPEFKTWKVLRLQQLDTLNFSKLVSFAKKFESKKLMSLIDNLKKYAASH